MINKNNYCGKIFQSKIVDERGFDVAFNPFMCTGFHKIPGIAMAGK